MSDTRRFIGTNKRFNGTRVVWVGPVCFSRLERWQGRKPHLHVMWDVRYVGFSALGFCLSVSR